MKKAFELVSALREWASNQINILQKQHEYPSDLQREQLYSLRVNTTQEITLTDTSNIARLILILESDRPSVEGEEIGFNMGTYIGPQNLSAHILDDRLPNCRTVACIAGHCFLLATGATIQEATEADADAIETTAAEFLGVDGEKASDLFFDLPEAMELAAVTIEQAITTLRHLQKTGEVIWLPRSE